MTALDLPVIPEWVSDALCSQTDPEIFFPTKGGSSANAKRVCRKCPVRTQCLNAALDDHTLDGVWGATNPGERTEIRARRGRGWPDDGTIAGIVA